ncbi:hypothetical protein [Streptomyces sp. GC420]|uniref:hypothetical protein n=1 Tax=Streptomyces sp. GC420 TaxID=2697568 RepID=UPI001FB6F5F9|nr:hypothetical protein [Streptomyces sp. GC420]
MRAELPALAERIDTQRVQTLRFLRGEVVELRARVEELRSVAAGLRTEQRLRRTIADQAPDQYTREDAARDAAVRDRHRPAADRHRDGLRSDRATASTMSAPHGRRLY